MERFTERDEFGNGDIIGVDCTNLQGNLDYEEFNRVTNALNRLADLEDKLEIGQLVELPCKVGDTVWVITGAKERFHIAEELCAGFNYGGTSNCDIPHLLILTPCYECGVYGMVFTDKAQAEARLKELQGK